MIQNSHTMKKNKTKSDKTKSAWLTFFYVGEVGSEFSEQTRRVFIINLFATVGALFTFPLGVSSLYEGKIALGLFLIFNAFLYLMNHVYLRYTHNYTVSGNLVIYPLYILMVFLIYTGGIHGTGHVWIYCVPAVALFLHGMKKGLIELAVFTAVLVVVMFFMDSHFDGAGYHSTLKSRIILSFLVVVFLSAIYEYSMSRFNRELKETSAKLKLVAYTDTLTELLNRRGMIQRLEETQVSSCHLLLADVDFFKRINDEYGHDVGDYALQTLGRLIQKSLPDDGLASRWGGEEFLIAVCDCTELDAFALAESIRQQVEGYEFNHLDQRFHMTLSFGVSTMDDKTSLRESITLADNRLYNAKHSGRNQTRRD